MAVAITSDTERSQESDTESVSGPSIFYRPATSTKVYDTVNACLFCPKLIKQKMRRHLIKKHQSETAVAEAMAGSRNQQDTKFTLLINRGNFQHNLRVLEDGKGEILLKRRPGRSAIPIGRFLPCPGCFAFMLRTDLHQHQVVCPGSSEDEGLDGALTIAKAENLLLRFSAEDSPAFLNDIRDESVRDIICGDATLTSYAKYTVDSKGEGENHIKSLRTRLVKLAKVLSDLRKKRREPNLTVREMCDVRYFDDIVAVTKEAAGYKSGTKNTPPTFTIPSVPRTVGTALGKVCHVLLGVALREENVELQRKVSSFRGLLDNEWGDKVGRASSETLSMRKQNVERELPTTHDMQRLQKHLHAKLESAIDAARVKFSVRAHNNLVSVVAVSLMVFNKRRGGEAVKIRVRDYTSRASYTQNETVIKSLSALERQIMSKMCLIKTRGKRGRTVPVIIPQLEKEAVDLLVSLRGCVGLRDDAPDEALLFTRAPSGKPLNGWYELRKACLEAGCKNIKSITSTNMRKYLATVVQIMNLSENEMDQVATHLGHDLAIHRKYYRLPDSTVELSKIAKLLLSTEGTLASNLDDDPEGKRTVE